MIDVQPKTAAAIDSGLWKLVPKLEWSPANSEDWFPLEPISVGISVNRTQQTRWTLNVKVAKNDLRVGPRGIHSYGCRIRAFVGVKPLRYNTEYLAYGVYSITAVSDSRDGITITGASEEVELQGAQFPRVRNLPDWPTYSLRQQAQILITEAIPTATYVWSPDLEHADDLMLPITVDRDRWGVLYGNQTSSSICNSLGAELYCDRNGLFTFAPVPILTESDPVATLAWDTYQLGRSNTYDRQNVYNLIVVTGQATDGQDPIGPVYSWDANPASLTYAGPDPVNRPWLAGSSFGVKPYFYNSSVVTSNVMAQNAARALLANTTGFNNYLTVESRFDPRIEVGDVVWVEQEDGEPVLCLIDAISYALENGTASITTRSTNGLSAGLIPS